MIEEVGQSVDVRLAFLQQDPQHSHRPKRDPQRIAAFLTQGMDILLEAEALLSRWQAQPGDRSVLETLLDELTTLGQSAYLAELWQVDEVCEALLDLYGAVEEGSLAASPRFFALAQQAHEALLDMFDEIAAGQALSARVDCIAAMRGLLDDALDPGSWAWWARMRWHRWRSTRQRTILHWCNCSSTRRAISSMAPTGIGAMGSGPGQPLGTVDPAARPPDPQRRCADGWRGCGGGVGPRAGRALRGPGGSPPGATAELLDLLRRGHQTLGQMLHALREGQAPASATALWRAARVPPCPTCACCRRGSGGRSQRSSDNELLEVFLEESSDIVESAAAALARWQADPRNSVEVENLLRDLHTLKGRADGRDRRYRRSGP